MCGIVGIFSSLSSNSKDLSPMAIHMANQIKHRGPDSSGDWHDEAHGIALGHRRLSIVDLSPAGHQPMQSHDGRYVMAFNGEIYNHLELRKDLAQQFPGYVWRGHSDTETLLLAISAWGLKRTLEQSHGMFAIALWDRQEKTLKLVRDRLGEKPLYSGICNGVLLFASELKALRAHPFFKATINRGAIALLLQQKYIPAPHSIYEGVFKLQTGIIYEFQSPNTDPRLEIYWDAKSVLTDSMANPFGGSAKEAADHLDALMRKSIQRQMLADVPLGAFLSGGIDSSTVVSIMQSLSSRPVKTFTIGFNEKEFNEAEHAKAVAKHLGTEHEELYVTAKHALDLVPRLPTVYCEPFADKSQIPTTLLCAMTRKHVTVALSGDGGDELFAGYTRYVETLKWWCRAQQIPKPLWGAASYGVGGMSLFDRKWREFADLLTTKSESQFYRRRVSKWNDAHQVVKGAFALPTIFDEESAQPQGGDFVHRMMGADLFSYLPDYILCKVDRAAMAASLETRIPLLDHEIVKFAWTLPTSQLLSEKRGKIPLRNVLDRYVPRELIERPKRGFNVPIATWLRGPLRDWAEALLNEQRLNQEGYFHSQVVRKQWAQHLSGKHNRSESLWSILMFQAWLESQKSMHG